MLIIKKAELQDFKKNTEIQFSLSAFLPAAPTPSLSLLLLLFLPQLQEV